MKLLGIDYYIYLTNSILTRQNLTSSVNVINVWNVCLNVSANLPWVNCNEIHTHTVTQACEIITT